MNNNNDDKIKAQVLRMQQHQQNSGQPFTDYLEGMMHVRPVHYWEYINLEILLGLQQPKTDFPDELIFITYHQICELYFLLIIRELEMITAMQEADVELMVNRLQRIIRYYKNLVSSFDIVHGGIEHDQFKKFRLSLFPASAFQSVQYRMIELYCTDLSNLVHMQFRPLTGPGNSIRALFKKLYWKHTSGRNDSNTKSLAAAAFDKKYEPVLLQKAREMQGNNVNQIFTKLFADDPGREIVVGYLKELDTLANVTWPLAHFKATAFHLRNTQGLAGTGTGGSDWRKYLPPHFQRLFYFPGIWTEEEKENWGLTYRHSTQVAE